MLVIVLNKTECLENILERLEESGITGATVLDSKGMAQSLCEYNELHIIASLRHLLDPERKENKTIFMVISEDVVSKVSRIVNEATGGLDKPDTGIMFAVPVSYVEGLEKKK